MYVVARHEPCCSVIYRLHVVDIILEMGVPHCTTVLQDRLHHCEIYATSFKTLQRLSLSLIAKIHVYTSTQSAVDDTEQSEV